jgi:hypothetical protein
MEGISQAIGSFAWNYDKQYSRHLERNRPDAKLFATEIPTFGWYHNKKQSRYTISGTMFSLMVYATAAERGDFIGMIGNNYLVGYAGKAENQIDENNVVHSSARAVTLYSRYFGDSLVRVTYSGMPTTAIRYYEAKWNTDIKTRDLPRLKTLASKSTGGDTLYVLVINNTKEEDIEASLHIESNYFTTDSIIGGWELTATSLTASNSVSKPDEISIREIVTPLSEGDSIIHLFPAASATVLAFDKVDPGIPEFIYNIAKEINGIRLWPNPVKGDRKLRLSCYSGDRENSIRIYDCAGRLVFKKKFACIHGKRNTHVLDVSSLERGVYIIKDETGNSARFMRSH